MTILARGEHNRWRLGRGGTPTYLRMVEHDEIRLENFTYNPHQGEAVYLDNIRLSTTKEAEPTPIH